ncbi:MAG: DoxX family protein [Bacteroidia bacterium]
MSKATRITAIVLKAIPSLMLVMSAVMKLTHAQAIVEGFSKSNLVNYITLIGLIELTSVILFWIPKTAKLGFLLLCAYLGGAISIELASGQFPGASVFLAIVWISVYLSDRSMFLGDTKEAGK